MGRLPSLGTLSFPNAWPCLHIFSSQGARFLWDALLCDSETLNCLDCSSTLRLFFLGIRWKSVSVWTLKKKLALVDHEECAFYGWYEPTSKLTHRNPLTDGCWSPRQHTSTPWGKITWHLQKRWSSALFRLKDGCHYLRTKKRPNLVNMEKAVVDGGQVLHSP